MAGLSNSRRILVSLALSVLVPRASWGLMIDPFTTYTRPANALIMPFDLTPHRSTQLIVSNLKRDIILRHWRRQHSLGLLG
jgi:hypothetical protein